MLLSACLKDNELKLMWNGIFGDGKEGEESHKEASNTYFTTYIKNKLKIYFFWYAENKKEKSSFSSDVCKSAFSLKMLVCHANIKKQKEMTVISRDRKKEEKNKKNE